MRGVGPWGLEGCAVGMETSRVGRGERWVVGLNSRMTWI